MKIEQYYKNLTSPEGVIDVILDTDAYNEIDDQFAISYMLLKPDKFNIKGITAAPFKNSRSESPADGMIKSYDEIIKLLTLCKKQNLIKSVYKGAEEYLLNEETPTRSEASDFIANIAEKYSPEKPLYIVAIGAITNIASAIILNPKIAENCVVVWLGGHAKHIPSPAKEFNMRQDITAARIVFECGVPLVQLPCNGVVDRFTTTKYELEYWLKGKNELCDYLCECTVNEAESYAKGKPWSRVIWDVTAVAWFFNEDEKFMSEILTSSPIPEYDLQYAENPKRHLIKYINRINRDAIFEDLFNTLSSFR